MVRRIAAWLLIAGFIFLVFNIIILHFYWEVSLAVYLVIMLCFVAIGNRTRYNNSDDRSNGGENDNDN